MERAVLTGTTLQPDAGAARKDRRLRAAYRRELRESVYFSAIVVTVSIVVGVLNGLQNMDKSTPWITLFDRASQHAHGAKFQVSFVDADADGQPEISLLCFGIQADRSITQVLFFKFSAQSAEVKTATGKLGVSMERLTGARDAIAARVKPFIQDYVTNLEL